MEYNPEFHARQFEPWTLEEDLYLLRYYKFDGLITISFALEKKETTVAGRIQKLKEMGCIFHE